MLSLPFQGIGCCPVEICIVKHKAGMQEEKQGRPEKIRTQNGRGKRGKYQ